jgi:O-antigen ligase
MTYHSKLMLKTNIFVSLGTAAAIAVFFQVYIVFSGGIINLNLADPFAIVALLVLSANVLFTDNKLPVWSIPKFNLALCTISVLLLFSFIRGWSEIGITQWALTGRLIGWLILLGYLSVGYLFVVFAKNCKVRQFFVAIIVTASFVVILCMSLRLLYYHWEIDLGVGLAPNFEGFSANRNAFAFQLLIAISLFLGYSKVYVRYLEINAKVWLTFLLRLILGILLVGLFWTGSRAGIGIGAILLIGSWYGRFTDRKLLGWALLFAVIIWLGVWIGTNVSLSGVGISISENGVSISGNGIMISKGGLSIQSGLSNEASNHERLATFLHGIDLWRQSPILGAGLGVFIAKSLAWFDHPQVIHNTTLWILAEFGLVGLLLFGWLFYMLCQLALTYRKSPLPVQRALIMILFTFAAFSLVHEIFYQRIFWLVLGALLVKPFKYIAAPNEKSA